MSKLTNEEKREARQEKAERIAERGKDVQGLGVKVMGIGCLGIILLGIFVALMAVIL